MSLCIGIRENQLEEVVRTIDLDKYKFKCLYDSNNYNEYYKHLNINVLRDALVFSSCLNALSMTRNKINGQETKSNLNMIMSNIFEEERQVPIVNDFFEYEYIVLVFTSTYKNRSEKGKKMNTVLTDDELDRLIARFLRELEFGEGIPTSTWQDYLFKRKTDDMSNMDTFIDRQKKIVVEKEDEYKRKIIKHFEESYKFRLITIYTKLRDYGLEDIMRKLDELGYLDDRFKGKDVFVYEEEARRLLSRRLCTLSFKNDIDVLINKGIINKDLIEYKI